MRNKTIFKLLSIIITLTLVMPAIHINAADFTPNPKTEYAKSFVTKCENEKWFINEIERLLNQQQKSINTLESSNDLNYIYALGFTDNKTIRKIPGAISELKNLKHLYFDGNQLTAIQPEIFKLTKLETLDMSNNKIAGPIPTAIGNLTNLKELALNNNEITGQIPAGLMTLTKLEHLDIANNKISGNIPQTISNLKNLLMLSAYNNKITGELPNKIEECTNLKAIILWNNQMSGTIPDIFSTLNKLEILDLAQNKFNGTLPVSLPTSIIEFSVRENTLTGSIPISYGNLANMEVFDIHKNKIEGKLPQELVNLTKMIKIDISENKLNETIEDIFINMDNLKTAWLNNNKFVGYAPDSLYTHERNGVNVDISKNYLTGETMLKLKNNLDNFVDRANTFQNRMVFPEYTQVGLNTEINLYNLFEHRDANKLSTKTTKEKLPVASYEWTIEMTDTQKNDLCVLYEVNSIDELYEIRTDLNGIYIKLLKEITNENPLVVAIKIKHNDGSDYSKTIFKIGAKIAPLITTPPITPAVPGGGGGGGGWYEIPETTTEMIAEMTTSSEPTPKSPILKSGTHKAYISGYPDKTFRANGSMTREEAATIFYVLIEEDNKDSFNATGEVYIDVSKDGWSAKAIEYLTNKKILAGYSDGSYRPKNLITRAEFTKLITNYKNISVTGKHSFPDIKGHWAEEAIKICADLGYVTGYPDGTFSPNKNITRAEAVTAMNKVLGRYPDENEVMLIESPFIDLNNTFWGYTSILEASLSHDYLLDDTTGFENWNE